MSEEKTGFWSIGPRPAAEKNEAHDSDDGGDVGIIGETTKASAQYDIVSIAPAERFQCVFKNSQRLRVCCWVMLRHKESGEVAITAAVSNSGSKGKMTLAIDLPDVDRFGPV